MTPLRVGPKIDAVLGCHRCSPEIKGTIPCPEIRHPADLNPWRARTADAARTAAAAASTAAAAASVRPPARPALERAPLTSFRAPIRPALRRCTPVGCRTYHHIRPPLRRTDDSHPPMPALRARCGPWEGDEGRALVYRYVWRDDLSDTFDESVRV